MAVEVGLLAHLSAALSVRRAIGTINEWNAALKGSTVSFSQRRPINRETHWRSPTPTQNSPAHNTTQHSTAQHKVIEEKPVLSFPKYPHPPDVWVLFALAGSDGIVSYRIVSYRTVSHSTVPVGLWRTLLSDFRFGWIFGFVSSVLSATTSTRRRPPEISYDLISPGSYLFKFIANFICCCSSAWHSFVQVRHSLSSLENS